MTILATGLEDDLRCEVKENVHRDDDDFYEDLIQKLYKPAKKPTVGEVITQQELPFEVEPAPESEPAADEDEWNTEEEAPVSPTMVSKWRAWLKDFMKDVKE